MQEKYHKRHPLTLLRITIFVFYLDMYLKEIGAKNNRHKFIRHSINHKLFFF